MLKEIKIAAELKNIKEVEIFLNSIIKQNGLNRKTFCKIYLAVIEAVNNAIIHGCVIDSKRYVKIVMEEKEDEFIFDIIDEGNGFDYKFIPDPTLSTNLLKESGRGIFIMKQYSDRIEFLKKGNHVKLYFLKV